jgi:hypothetical protein
MSAIRYSGELRIRVTLLDITDSNGRYQYRCHVRGPADAKTVFVGSPASIGHAIDSTEAFDSVAHAAISFADDAGSDTFSSRAATKVDGSGWHIGRNAKAAWPRVLPEGAKCSQCPNDADGFVRGTDKPICAECAAPAKE